MAETWSVSVLVHRKKGNSPSYFDRFTIQANPDEYVLDLVERIWAYHDRTLTFAHACHHSVCGACGMRANGSEKLTCITLVRDVTSDGGTLKLEPMRNFPVISDLVVDMGWLYSQMDRIDFRPVVPVGETPEDGGIRPSGDESEMERLVDCIECGLCISACPIVATSPSYLGPAVLAAAEHQGIERRPDLLDLLDSQDGVWRCHGIHECTEVCPSSVQPAWRIMNLRKELIKHKVRQVFRPHRERTH